LVYYERQITEKRMPKQIQIQCTREVGDIIIQALSWYVEAHYPRAADECSAAAREALLDLVAQFERELLVDGQSAYSSRIRAFVCEAVKGYVPQLSQRLGESFQHREALIIAICRGESDGRDYAEAAVRDRTVSTATGQHESV
jgi:hypothetical protein